MTYGGGPSGGYIIDYSSNSSTLRAVFRWHRRVVGQEAVITPLPDGSRLSYRGTPNDVLDAHVREFTTEQVAYLDVEALGYMFVAELYETIWADIPGESPFGIAQCTK